MKVILEKADIGGYEISDLEFEKFQIFNGSNVIVSSAELGGLKDFNPKDIPELYLNMNDYNRIYKNIVGDVLAIGKDKE